MLGIRARLTFLGVLPTALVGLGLAAYFTQTRITDIDQDLRTQSDLLVRELSVASASPLVAGDRAALRRIAESALLNGDVVHVAITGRDGLAVFVERPQDEAEPDYAPRFSLTAQILPVALPVGTQAPAGQGASASSPPAPEPVGSVSLELSKQGTLKRQYDTLGVSVVLLLGGVALTLLLARRMARKIGEPVMALTMAVHALSKGDMDARAESEAEAELAYLQAGFNAMAAELKRNRDSLELQVGLATARLQEALEALETRNKELEAARWLAEAQTELKSRFLAQMSHEIRTPMTGIIGFSELLAKTGLDDEQAEKLGLITRSAKNLLAIINEILDLSKLESGKINLDPRPFALRPCLEDIVCLLCVRVPAPSIALWIDPAVPAVIEGDPVRLQQVIANLLGNALKFTRRGRIVIRVRVLSSRKGRRLLFSVSDTGSGISRQDQARLFSPFLQLGEPSFAAERGTGLGLSIAKNIVESMGGEIRLASRLGKGTSLWFDLPLVEAGAVEPQPVVQGVVGLVEQDRLFRQALCGQLASLGVRVEAFATADELFAHFEGKDAPNYLIYGVWPKREKTDAALPGWLEWCERLGKRPVLLFPRGERRMVGYYRKRGAACLFHPLRGEALAKSILSLDAVAAPLEPATPESQDPALAGPAAGLRFLLADDNETNRLLLCEQLRRFDAEQVEARNGGEALERLRREHFDLVFLDLQMPDVDGWEVLRELRNSRGPNRQVPVVAITAFANPEGKGGRDGAGFDACLLKPVSEAELVGLVSRLVGSGSWRLPQKGGPSGNAKPAQGYAAALIRKTGGDVDTASVIAHKLFDELPESLLCAEVAICNREAGSARYAVHKINGSAGFAGLENIRQAAMLLESSLVKGDDWEFCEDLCRKLRREADAFLGVESLVLDQIEQAGEP